jgi:hypothetical protein
MFTEGLLPLLPEPSILKPPAIPLEVPLLPPVGLLEYPPDVPPVILKSPPPVCTTVPAGNPAVWVFPFTMVTDTFCPDGKVAVAVDALLPLLLLLLLLVDLPSILRPPAIPLLVPLELLLEAFTALVIGLETVFFVVLLELLLLELELPLLDIAISPFY